MKLVCPSCGAVCSADSWVNDPVCREALVTLSLLPQPLPKVVLSYIALFRSGKNKALSWKKTARLLQEIADLAALGYVKKTGCPDRDCSPAIWAKAMEEMVGKRDFLSLPMPNHNYLKKVAWDLADQADLAREKTPVKRQPQRSMASNDPLQAAKDRWDREHAGQPVIIPGIGKIEDIVKGVK